MSWHNPFSLGQKHLGMYHPISLVWWPHPPAWLLCWISTFQMLHLCHADLCEVTQMHMGVSPVFWEPQRVGRQRGGGVPQTCSALQCCPTSAAAVSIVALSLSLYKPVTVMKYCKNKSRPSNPCSGSLPGGPWFYGACLGEHGVAAAETTGPRGAAVENPIYSHGQSCAAPGN